MEIEILEITVTISDAWKKIQYINEESSAYYA